MTQRHCTEYFTYVKEEKESILKDVQDFFVETIQENFPSKNCKFVTDFIFQANLPFVISIVLIDNVIFTSIISFS